MISVQLDEIARKLGKSISDIARDTGLNRNTITALYHNKVDGIRFSTIETICSTYNLNLQDIIVMSVDAGLDQQLYRQEVEGLPIYSWSWFNAIVDPNMGIAPNTPEQGYMYHKDNSVAVYWYEQKLNEYAAGIYDAYKERSAYDRLFSDFQLHANQLQQLYYSATSKQINAYSKKELVDFASQVRTTYELTWKYSAFIDTFDAGFDEQEITRIASEHGLSIPEMGVLLTPQQLSFYELRELELIRLVQKYKSTWSIDDEVQLKKQLEKFVEKKEDMLKYKNDFAWYLSNYNGVKKILDVEIVDEIIELLNEWETALDTKKDLESYEDRQQKNVQAVLKKHKLKENPLWFFERLTQWRRHERKQASLMGVHVLHRLLIAIERWTAIDYEVLGYLSFDEVNNVLHGLVTKRTLQARKKGSIMVALEGEEYSVLHDGDADRIVEQFDRQIAGSFIIEELQGQSIYPGEVTGTARVIVHQQDFDSFNEGEILVTAMTRPEFYPLMKKAAGIVTTEGGVSCHAIRARDLGIPCVIGVQRAMHKIEDGQQIILNASTGIITIKE